MTIDRAIKREQAKAEEYRAMSSEGNAEIAEIYIRCSKYHEQLADWLEELKILREEKSEFQIIAKDIAEYNYEMGMENGYNKAIDDFVKMLYEELLYEDGLTEIDVDYIAEQLKEGGKDE